MSIPANILGTRIGAYEVQAILGSGGMATVYRGFDHNLHRPVAIKVLSEVAQPDFAARFRQEARLIARLHHPNIVQVYDLVEQEGVMYMVQELLPGQTLAERLSELAARHQMMPRREVMAVVQQLAAALDAAHLAGIIHRDVKPSNILYNANGALVLTDFGIAKSTAPDATKTQTGMVLGTPTYVSPEQARGETLTPASDIYALGVVLYELISGQPPFDGGTALEIVFKHLHEAPPLLQPLRASVTPQVEAVVQRALAKRPEDRFTTASQLAQALVTAWPEPLPAAPSRSVHELPTTAWQVPDPVIRTPAVGSPVAVPISGAPAELAGVDQPVAPPSRPARRFLPILALLLVGTLLVGTVLAWRGQAGRASPADTTVQATQAVATLNVPTEDGPLAQVRQILGASATPAMSTSLDTAEQALLANDKPGAIQALGALQLQILADRQADSISVETMNAALAAVQEIAQRNDLQLELDIGR